MKQTFSNFSVITLKVLFTLTITVAMVGFTKCDAQSVVGKWKEVSNKLFFTPEGIKRAKGRVSEDLPGFNVVDEFNADKTFTETSPAANNVSTGTWALTGDKMKITIKGAEPINVIVSVNGNTLVITMMMQDKPHQTTSKSEKTFTKM